MLQLARPCRLLWYVRDITLTSRRATAQISIQSTLRQPTVTLIEIVTAQILHDLTLFISAVYIGGVYANLDHLFHREIWDCFYIYNIETTYNFINLILANTSQCRTFYTWLILMSYISSASYTSTLNWHTSSSDWQHCNNIVLLQQQSCTRAHYSEDNKNPTIFISWSTRSIQCLVSVVVNV